MKKCKFIIFLDKDDTVNIDDKELNNIFDLVISSGGKIVFVTGRTVGDIEEDFQKKNIKMPYFIVGDNGGVFYSPSEQRFIKKKTLQNDKVVKIVDEFIKCGGNPSYIRYTNGAKVFTSEDKAVKKYYRKSERTESYSDICEQIKDNEDITKITLAGNKNLMMHMAEFAGSIEYWTDMDKTRFPNSLCKNYRLDIAEKNINKGEAVKEIVAEEKPEYGYMCIGNGYNDVSMFKAAIDDNMLAVIMENAPIELIQEIKQYAKDCKKGKVGIIPKNKNLSNRYIYKMMKVLEDHIKKEERKYKISRRLPNVERVNLSTKRKSPQSRKRNYYQRKPTEDGR
ncbi:MAG: HAD family phosphatase [Clostridia bacterium]|nr:HAD family phosphatase [Clostridia bacterium]